MKLQSAKQLLSQLGLAEEEMAGIDVIRFVQDYELDARAYSAEELRAILAEEGAFYLDDGVTQVYAMLDEPGGEALKEDDAITAVAYLYNNGTFNERAVIDLDERFACLNDAEKRPLSPENAAALAQMPRQYEISRWRQEYNQPHPTGTGSLAWRLVFRTAEGAYCVYSGYTSDGSCLPEHLDDVMKTLRAAAQ